MFLYSFLYFCNYFFANVFKLTDEFLTQSLKKLAFLKNFYKLSELVWQEGLLIDFLQKKIIDNWVKKFLIYSAYLFNERFLFDKLTRIYLDIFLWPLHKLAIFETNNIGMLFFFVFFFFVFSFLLFSLLYFSIILY